MLQKELSGGHCAGEPRAFRPDKTPFKWSFLVRKARHPPVTRSFSRRPRLHFPVDLSSAQHHAQAPKIAHTLPHPTDHSQLLLFSCRMIGGSTSHSLWLVLSFDSGLLCEVTKSVFCCVALPNKQSFFSFSSCRTSYGHVCSKAFMGQCIIRQCMLMS